jgi:tripeptide aminopeptidase
VNLAAICGIFVHMAAPSPRATEDSIAKLAHNPACARALAWITRNSDWVTDQQIRLAEIPAPAFQEAARGQSLKTLFEAADLPVHTDSAGNVIAERAGSDPSAILFVAHLDTVFPEGTDLRVKRDGARLMAPGISDDAVGLAALAGLARVLAESSIRTKKTILLAGGVGEEGEGNLRGIRALVDTYRPRLAAVIAVDGASTDFIATQAIASRRLEVAVTGPGGHSWSDFGAPNPIAAVSRGIVQFSSIRLPKDPRSTYNFGAIEGGTSINSIPARVSVKVDLRSEDASQLARLESALRAAMQAGVREELSASGARSDALLVAFHSLGDRPSGKLPNNSPLLATIRDADLYLGISSRLESSSTDANIPLSLGIPAVALGAGGTGGGSHTLAEWYDPTGRHLGLQRLFLIAVALAGLER